MRRRRGTHDAFDAHRPAMLRDVLHQRLDADDRPILGTYRPGDAGRQRQSPAIPDHPSHHDTSVRVALQQGAPGASSRACRRSGAPS